MDITITFGSIDDGGNLFTWPFRDANKKMIEACELAFAEISGDLHRNNYEAIKRGENDVAIVGNINRVNANIKLMGNKEDFEIRMDLLPPFSAESIRFPLLESLNATIIQYCGESCPPNIWDDIVHLSIICERLKNSREYALRDMMKGHGLE